MQHGESTRSMFPGYPHASITNRVPMVTWTRAPFQVLSDQYLPGWQCDTCMLCYAIGMPEAVTWGGHQAATRALVAALHHPQVPAFAITSPMTT
jgi:starch phosphorylase